MENVEKCYFLPAESRASWYKQPEVEEQPGIWFDSVRMLRMQSGVSRKVKTSICLQEKNSCSWLVLVDDDIKLSPIYAQINETEKYFSNADNSDEEEGLIFNLETFRRASSFLIKYTKEVLRKLNILIDVPNIYPGPDNSIDIYWENDFYELLLNIPPIGNSIATYYGDNKNNENTKGTINLDAKNINLGLILFLSGQK